MTETRVAYLTKNIVQKKIHRCPGCWREFGFETGDGNLVVGELVLSFFKGECGNCGNVLKFYSTDLQMEKIVARAKSRKIGGKNETIV